MADYTTQLRTICEFYAGEAESQGYNKIDEIVEKSAPHIFEPFDIFDEDYRMVLEKKILRHFYTREICMETVGLWKLHFNNKLHEIMPYYNQLYKSQLLKFNPFYDVDVTREHDRTNDGETNVDSDNKSTTDTMANKTGGYTDDNTHKMVSDRNLDEENKRLRNDVNKTIENTENKRTANLSNTYTPDEYEVHEVNKFLDTPQSRVQNLDDGYLSDVRDIRRTENGETVTKETGTDTTKITSGVNETVDSSVKDNRSVFDSNTEENKRFNKHEENSTESNYTDAKSNTKTKEKTNNIETFFEKVRGKQGTKSYSRMLQEFRDTFLNIDMMIIKDLEPLFFGLW